MQALAPPLSTSLYQDTWCFHSSLLWPGVTEPPSTFSLPLVSGLLSNWAELPALVWEWGCGIHLSCDSKHWCGSLNCVHTSPSLLHILLCSCVFFWLIRTAQHWDFNSWEHLQHHTQLMCTSTVPVGTLDLSPREYSLAPRAYHSLLVRRLCRHQESVHIGFGKDSPKSFRSKINEYLQPALSPSFFESLTRFAAPK